MTIRPFSALTSAFKKIAKSLWEDNMHESWQTYDGSDMFVVENDGRIVCGFAVYRDTSDGISGLFCSGWAGRHEKVPCGRILQLLASSVGDVYLKTDKRTAKILLEKIGKRVKTTDRFGYYIIKGK